MQRPTVYEEDIARGAFQKSYQKKGLVFFSRISDDPLLSRMYIPSYKRQASYGRCNRERVNLPTESFMVETESEHEKKNDVQFVLLR